MKGSQFSIEELELVIGEGLADFGYIIKVPILVLADPRLVVVVAPSLYLQVFH